MWNKCFLLIVLLATAGMLFVPKSQTSTIEPRAFAISSPSAWNSLPVDLRDPELSYLSS